MPPARVREDERHEQPVESHDRPCADDAGVTARRHPQREPAARTPRRAPRVPVPDRRTQPREPPVVLVQPRPAFPPMPTDTSLREAADEPPTSRGATTGRRRRRLRRTRGRRRRLKYSHERSGAAEPEDRHPVPGNEPSREAGKGMALSPNGRRRQDSPEHSAARSDRGQERAERRSRRPARRSSRPRREATRPESGPDRREQGQRSRSHSGEATTRSFAYKWLTTG